MTEEPTAWVKWVEEAQVYIFKCTLKADAIITAEDVEQLQQMGAYEISIHEYMAEDGEMFKQLIYVIPEAALTDDQKLVFEPAKDATRTTDTVEDTLRVVGKGKPLLDLGMQSLEKE